MVLTRYPWPGNIRELDNMIARAVILSPRDKDEIEADINYHFWRPTAVPTATAWAITTCPTMSRSTSTLTRDHPGAR